MNILTEVKFQDRKIPQFSRSKRSGWAKRREEKRKRGHERTVFVLPHWSDTSWEGGPLYLNFPDYSNPPLFRSDRTRGDKYVGYRDRFTTSGSIKMQALWRRSRQNRHSPKSTPHATATLWHPHPKSTFPLAHRFSLTWIFTTLKFYTENIIFCHLFCRHVCIFKIIFRKQIKYLCVPVGIDAINHFMAILIIIPSSNSGGWVWWHPQLRLILRHRLEDLHSSIPKLTLIPC